MNRRVQGRYQSSGRIGELSVVVPVLAEIISAVCDTVVMWEPLGYGAEANAAQALFGVGDVVPAVQIKKIDIVHAQPFQAFLELRRNQIRRAVEQAGQVVRAAAHGG